MCTKGALVFQGGLTLRRFSPSDPFAIEAREDFAKDMIAMGDRPDPFAPRGLCWTLTETPHRWSRPVGCGGFDDLGGGRWGAWAYGGTVSPRVWAIVRHAFRLLEIETRARRIEACIRAEGPYADRARQYACSLGFAFEGRMRSYGADGTDYDLYAKVN